MYRSSCGSIPDRGVRIMFDLSWPPSKAWLLIKGWGQTSLIHVSDGITSLLYVSDGCF